MSVSQGPPEDWKRGYFDSFYSKHTHLGEKGSEARLEEEGSTHETQCPLNFFFQEELDFSCTHEGYSVTLSHFILRASWPHWVLL